MFGALTQGTLDAAHGTDDAGGWSGRSCDARQLSFAYTLSTLCRRLPGTDAASQVCAWRVRLIKAAKETTHIALTRQLRQIEKGIAPGIDEARLFDASSHT